MGLLWYNRTEILDSVFFYLYLLFYLLRTRLKTNSSSHLEEIFLTFLKSALQFMTQQNWRQFQLRKYLFEKFTWRYEPWRTSCLVPVVSLPFVFLSAKSYSLIFSWYFGSIFLMYIRWYIFWSWHLLFMREVITSN